MARTSLAALFNLGNATVVGCTFTNNHSLGGGNFYSNMGGSCGGAIDNYDGAILTVTDSLFSNNSVVSADSLLTTPRKACSISPSAAPSSATQGRERWATILHRPRP